VIVSLALVAAMLLAPTVPARLPPKPPNLTPPPMQDIVQDSERFRKGPILDQYQAADTIVNVSGSPCALADAYYCYDPVLLSTETGGVQKVKIVVDETGAVSECYGPKLPESPALLNQSCRVATGGRFLSCAEMPDLPCEKRQFYYYFSWFVPVNDSFSRLPKPAGMPEFDTAPRIGQPISPCGNLVCSSDYPARSLALQEQGGVSFQILVSAEGFPIQCWVFEASGYPELDNATCGIMLSRMRFKPATDADGQSVQSVYTNRITWRIPQD
jgi:TonB family protein